jgi:hypothetical protein
MFKRHTIAAATLGVSMTIVGIAFAQQPTPAPAQPPARDGTATDHRGMMQGGDTMPTMENMSKMMEQMSKMMESCNRMMQPKPEK